jgi:5-methylcytosine-specific restriction endonuclease McrA
MSKRKITTEYKHNAKILKSLESVCAICGGEVLKNVGKYHPLSANIDHIYPKSEHGSDSMENLQLTHRKCNMQKYNKVGIKPFKIIDKITRSDFPQIF